MLYVHASFGNRKMQAVTMLGSYVHHQIQLKGVPGLVVTPTRATRVQFVQMGNL